jgi:hypothetical protein
MSYARKSLPLKARRRGGITVGSGASTDPILARASYDASQILLRAVRQPAAQRVAFVRRELRRYGPGSDALFDAGRSELLRQGRGPNQALYDAMRAVAANDYARKGMTAIRAALAREVSGEYADGLGDDAKDIGCGIAGGATAILALIGGLYAGEGGASAAGTGGSLVSGALDCNADARASQERIAAAGATAAQIAANAAIEVAAAEERAEAARAAERTKQVKTIAIFGGGALLLLATGYAIVRV